MHVVQGQQIEGAPTSQGNGHAHVALSAQLTLELCLKGRYSKHPFRVSPRRPEAEPRPDAEGISSMTVKSIATYKNPDLDALVATWLAQRFLFAGEPCEVVFVP